MTLGYSFSVYAQQLGSLLIALLGFILFFRRELNIKILAWYGANSFVFQIIGNLLIYTKTSQYLNLSSNLYTLAEALILLLFFHALFNSRFAKKLTLAFAAAYIIIYFILISNHWMEFVSSTRTLRDLFIIICSLIYFYFLIAEMPASDITKYPMFWIIAAFLFFFAGTFALSLSLDYLVKKLRDDMALLWIMRNYFRFLFCLVVCYGLLLDLKQVKAKPALVK